ncbi:hypothetical protein SXIM_16650 [Streptomyces xiamenensis]|uniref:Uncharacterized protein n=1 Tax=Streptomyces xiamenensis TaxID=408015 RepID=A0A0F7FSC8_9ACTN|nr:hypothetical protein SXIM_16650 [Streptomyces xiamenensis]
MPEHQRGKPREHGSCPLFREPWSPAHRRCRRRVLVCCQGRGAGRPECDMADAASGETWVTPGGKLVR